MSRKMASYRTMEIKAIVIIYIFIILSGCTASTDHYKTSQCGMKIEYNCDCDCRQDSIDGLVEGAVNGLTN